MDIIEELRDKGFYLVVVMCFLMIAVSGLFFAGTYFIMDSMNTALLSTDCVIDNNTLVSSCQELFQLSFYPVLALKDVLIFASYFFIFGLVLALLLLGYRSGKSPVMIGVLVSLVGGLTYLAIMVSNTYRTLLENEIMRDIMVEFVIYNKIMLYFPIFVFFIGLFSVVLSIVNYQKSSVSSLDGEFNY